MRIDALDANLANMSVQMLSNLTNWEQYGELMDELDPVTGQVTGKITPIHSARPGQVGKTKNPLMNANGILDLYEITRMLDVSQNKVKILKLLRRRDWIRILSLLPKALLVNALRLFDKSKLLRMIMMLPKEMLVAMLLRIYKMDELIMKMPTVELMRILRSQKLNNSQLLKGLKAMDPKFLMLLLQRIYGDYNFQDLKPWDISRIIMQTSKARLMEGFKTLSFKALIPFVTGFVKEDPQLLLLMSEDFIFKLFDQMSKPTLLESCMALPDEILIKMLSQLPDQGLIVAAAQIDDKLFEAYLISEHPELLYMLAGAA